MFSTYVFYRGLDVLQLWNRVSVYKKPEILMICKIKFFTMLLSFKDDKLASSASIAYYATSVQWA